MKLLSFIFLLLLLTSFSVAAQETLPASGQSSKDTTKADVIPVTPRPRYPRYDIQSAKTDTVSEKVQPVSNSDNEVVESIPLTGNTNSTEDAQVVESVPLTGNTNSTEDSQVIESIPVTGNTNSPIEAQVVESSPTPVSTNTTNDSQIVESVPLKGNANTTSETQVVENIPTPVSNNKTIDAEIVESTPPTISQTPVEDDIPKPPTSTVRQVITKPATTSPDGHIQAWHNPPGYMGSQKKVTMVKKKHKRHKNSGIHGKQKPKGCYD